jgi:hypothetical protein
MSTPVIIDSRKVEPKTLASILARSKDSGTNTNTDDGLAASYYEQCGWAFLPRVIDEPTAHALIREVESVKTWPRELVSFGYLGCGGRFKNTTSDLSMYTHHKDVERVMNQVRDSVADAFGVTTPLYACPAPFRTRRALWGTVRGRNPGPDTLCAVVALKPVCVYSVGHEGAALRAEWLALNEGVPTGAGAHGGIRCDRSITATLNEVLMGQVSKICEEQLGWKEPKEAEDILNSVVLAPGDVLVTHQGMPLFVHDITMADEGGKPIFVTDADAIETTTSPLVFTVVLDGVDRADEWAKARATKDGIVKMGMLGEHVGGMLIAPPGAAAGAKATAGAAVGALPAPAPAPPVPAPVGAGAPTAGGPSAIHAALDARIAALKARNDTPYALWDDSACDTANKHRASGGSTNSASYKKVLGTLEKAIKTAEDACDSKVALGRRLAACKTFIDGGASLPSALLTAYTKLSGASLVKVHDDAVAKLEERCAAARLVPSQAPSALTLNPLPERFLVNTPLFDHLFLIRNSYIKNDLYAARVAAATNADAARVYADVKALYEEQSTIMTNSKADVPIDVAPLDAQINLLERILTAKQRGGARKKARISEEEEEAEEVNDDDEEGEDLAAHDSEDRRDLDEGADEVDDSIVVADDVVLYKEEGEDSDERFFDEEEEEDEESDSYRRRNGKKRARSECDESFVLADGVLRTKHRMIGDEFAKMHALYLAGDEDSLVQLKGRLVELKKRTHMYGLTYRLKEGGPEKEYPHWYNTEEEALFTKEEREAMPTPYVYTLAIKKLE